jgi:multiple sugar transport system ATP-binding protein
MVEPVLVRNEREGKRQPRDGKDVLVGVRPEHLIDPPAARGAAEPIRAVVEVVEPLGDEVIVHARAGDHLLVYRLAPERTPRVGDELAIAVELERLHLFDPETEERLGA